MGIEIFQNVLNHFLIPNKPKVTAVSFFIVLGTMCINYLVMDMSIEGSISKKSGAYDRSYKYEK